MARMAEAILGRRRKPAPPPVQARRAPPTPAPATAPVEPPAPAVQAREPPAPPAKRAPGIRAIVIDPMARTVDEVRLATEPGDAKQGFGTQLAEDAVEDIVGEDAAVEALDLSDGEVVLVDALRQSETTETWTMGDDEAIVGKGVIVAYDPQSDAYADTAMSIDEARELVVFEDDAEDQGDEITNPAGSKESRRD